MYLYFMKWGGGGGWLSVSMSKDMGGWLTRGGRLTRASTVIHVHVCNKCFVAIKLLSCLKNKL